MNLLIETLNRWGEQFFHFAGPMLWQSSLLIVVLLALDFALRRKARAIVRYSLWLVVLVKLLLSPTFALPTSIAWWLRTTTAARPETREVIVTYGKTIPTVAPIFALPPRPTPPPKLSRTGGLLAASIVISFGLLTWMFFRWRQVAQLVRAASAATDALNSLVEEGRRSIGLHRVVQLRLTDRPMSPAVCGLFRPVIILPRSLAEQLTPDQLRAVLLHELVHLKRGDVWVNCVQALLQIAYWWNPLLWLANARIRRLREEVVDDAVMLALRDDAEIYAPTLLQVAKLSFCRPLASLGLVGIMESRNALRQRIERLVNYSMPRKTGISLVSLLGIAAFTALAVPMGEAPKTPTQISPSKQTISKNLPLILADGGSRAVEEQKPHFVVDPIAVGDANAKLAGELSPDARPGAATKVSMVYILEVHEDGSYQVGKKRFDLAGLKIWLADPNKRNAPIGYRLNIHSNAPPESVRALTELCKEVGITLITTSLGKPTEPLFVRTFKVDPNTVFGHLKERTGLTSTNTEAISEALRKVFGEQGVELQAPKNLFFNPRQGTLLVRASMAELDQIEGVIQELNYWPPQVNVRVRFVELSDNDSRVLGIFWNHLETTNAAQHVSGNSTLQITDTDILTDSQYRVVLRALEQKDVALLARQEVTTLSGHQAQIQVVDMQTVVTGIKPEALTPPGVISTNKEDDSLYLTTETIPFGPVLDVLPTVSADGFTVQLTVTPTVTEFLGYDDPKTNTTVYVNGKKGSTTLPLPRFRLRQWTTSTIVWDGQTLVLRNPRDQVISKQPNGDTFVEDFTAPKKRNLLIFITATIIDPAGNRVHKDEEVPSGGQAAPPSKPAK